MSFFDKHETVITVIAVIAVVVVIVGAHIGLSVAAYHWVDRPGQHVDGRWFTIGAFCFWSLTHNSVRIGSSNK